MFCYSFFYYSLSLRLYSGLFSVIYVLSACITIVVCTSFPTKHDAHWHCLERYELRLRE
jgi:hypothetical protein